MKNPSGVFLVDNRDVLRYIICINRKEKGQYATNYQ